jgi:NAD(P)-dependent dehydrogenase (short-subunit alcohol dehydrogenase family)
LTERTRPPLDRGTVVITGASAGIGREFAVQLAPRVAALVLLAMRIDRLDQLRTELLTQHKQRAFRMAMRLLPLRSRRLRRSQAAYAAVRLRLRKEG